MRTYSRDSFEEARALWDEGEFSREWRNVRHKAAMVAGIIYPPSGSKWDSWEDDAPSQRAILIRAIRETPTLLDRAITPRCKSWADVIANLIRQRDDLRAEWHQPEPDEDVIPHREAAMALGAILRRISDSVG